MCLRATGLDPTVRHVIWEKVRAYRAAGKTVLVTTHYMHEAEILCDRVVILNRGVVVDAGSPADRGCGIPRAKPRLSGWHLD